MSPNARKAIRRFCLDCQGGHALSVRACADVVCILYPLRHGVGTEEAAQGGEERTPLAIPPSLCPQDGVVPTTEPSDKVSAETPRPLHSLLPFACHPASAQAGALPSDQAAMPEQEEASRPARLIRLFCLTCAGNRQDVRVCDAKASCALWSFRFGVSPATFKRVVVRRQLWRSRLSLPGLPR